MGRGQEPGCEQAACQQTNNSVEKWLIFHEFIVSVLEHLPQEQKPEYRVDGEGSGEVSVILKRFIEKFSVGVKNFYTTRIDPIPNLYFSTSPVSKTLPTS